METAHNQTPPVQKIDTQEGERRCLVLNEVLPKEQLLRFILTPDSASVVPDLAENLPGRGYWVSASKEVVREAIKKSLFSRAARITVTCDPNIPDQIELMMRQRCLNYIGLARSAGLVVLGQPQFESAYRSDLLALGLLASDSVPASSFTTLFLDRQFTRNELGAACGHDQLVYVGIKPHALTTKLKDSLVRLMRFCSPQSETGINPS